jgi:hypothetical protein
MMNSDFTDRFEQFEALCEKNPDDGNEVLEAYQRLLVDVMADRIGGGDLGVYRVRMVGLKAALTDYLKDHGVDWPEFRVEGGRQEQVN